VARLADGVTVEQAQAEVDAITAALAGQHPSSNKDVGARIRLFTHAFVAPPPEAQEPLVMMIAAAIVLLIACANGANLLLARAAQRSREIAMRATLGASRLRIVRQLLVEALLIAIAAGAIGLVVSVAAVGAFGREVVDMNLPFWIRFDFDARVFSYVAIACLGTAIAFGLAPAWQLSRTDAHDVLKDGGRGAIGGPSARRWSGALLVAEIALTLMLLGASSILVRSSAALAREDAVVDLDQLMTASVGLPATRYDTPDERRLLHTRIRERLDVAPTIAATLSSARPFVDATGRELLLDTDTRAPDRTRTVQTIGVDTRYFETLGLPLLRGRALRPEDAMPGQQAVVINDRFADQYFPQVNPVGRRVRLVEPRSNAAPGEGWFTIVGVSRSLRQRPMSRAAPLAYLPLDVHLGMTLAITARAADDLEATTRTLREELRAVDPDVAAYNIVPLRRLSQLSRWPARLVSLVLAVFAAIASVLSAAGLYGMTAYGVAQRTSEIGLRVALGARRSQIAWFFLRTTLWHVAIGLVIGLAGVVAAGQLLSGLLFATSANDPLMLASIIVALGSVTAAACFFPARRAMRLDPVAALRHE
jgi:putative ABC transport system permease protein